MAEPLSKRERFIEMIIIINAKKHFALGELRKEFDVSKRTIL